jgi:phage tail-like protein
VALLNAVGLRTDPLLSHNFMVALLDSSSALALAGTAALAALTDVAAGGFSECTGLEMSLDIKEYEEGGNNGYVRKFPTRVKWANITLKKGMGAGTALWDWHYGFATGRGKRRDGVIVLLDDRHLPRQIWYFRRGLPVKYSGPALNAQQNSVAIESIDIAHEGIYEVPGVGYAGAALSTALDLGGV